MAKRFAIIEDEEGEKRIVSSTWLSKNGQKMKWPPYKDIDRIKKAAIGHDKPDEDWKEYSIRFIKYKGKFDELLCGFVKFEYFHVLIYVKSMEKIV